MTRVLALLLLLTPPALAADRAPRSGLEYATPGVRAMQEDDFANPGMLWVQEGLALWDKPGGMGSTSCGSCHGRIESMAGISYPRRDPREPDKLMNLETRIEKCRLDNMGAPVLGYESRELLALTAAIRHQARGKPVTVADDADAVAAGEKEFRRRRGALDLSCAQCHEASAGKKLRDETISEGHTNGFPAYRVRWQGVGSLHRRFQVCNQAVAAEPYPLGAQEYIALEWYLAKRGAGLAVETPAARQ